MHHRRHTGDHFVEERYGDVNHHVVQRAARGEQGFKRRDAPQGDRCGQEQERRPGADHLSCRIARTGQGLINLRGAHVGEAENTHRLPAFQEQRQTDQRHQRRDDVRQLRAEEVRAEVLGNRERTARHHHRRPGLLHAAPAVHNRHDPEQDDNGQEGQLAANHLADLEAVQPGDLSGHQNRNTHRAKRNRRGVHNQAQARGIERVKAQTDQQRGGDRHRCAKACRAFQKRPEGEADNQHLQALVRRDGENRRADNVELPGFHRDFIDKHRRDDDPRNRPQAVEETVDDGGQRAIDRHFIEEQRHHQGDSNGIRRGEVALQLELNQRKEEEQDRKRCDQARQPDISGRVVVLLPEAHAGLLGTRQPALRVSLRSTLRHRLCKSGPANVVL